MATFTTSSSSSAVTFDDSSEETCSICLEPFTTHDPATITSCEHDYHLHCIIEWSQRSKECPVCWQLLSLKDPASQELLRNGSSSAFTNSRSPLERDTFDHDGSLSAEFALVDRRIVEGAIRARYNHQMEMHLYYGADPSEAFALNSSLPSSGIQPTHTTSPSSGVTFSDSFKSKISAASARYKESISKATRGLKEKLIARNASVKELSKGVQREMNAGISGVARMIECLNLTSKRSNSGIFMKGKSVQENSGFGQSPKEKNSAVFVYHVSSDSPAMVSSMDAGIPPPSSVQSGRDAVKK